MLLENLPLELQILKNLSFYGGYILKLFKIPSVGKCCFNDRFSTGKFYRRDLRKRRQSEDQNMRIVTPLMLFAKAIGSCLD